MKKNRYPIIDGHKVCSKCGELKPLSEFYQNKTGKGRLFYCCKDCSRKRGHEYYLANKEKIRQQQKESYQEAKNHRESHDKRQKEMYKTSILLRCLDQYDATDYLKKFEGSRKKVQDKLEALLHEVQEKGFKSPADQKRQEVYEVLLAKWDSKIMQIEDLLAIYKGRKGESKEEKQKQEPQIINDMKDQKLSSASMTKESLIGLLTDVPDDALVTYVGNTNGKPSLIAVWKTDEDNLCVRNLSRNMPHIIADSPICQMFSTCLPEDCTNDEC